MQEQKRITEFKQLVEYFQSQCKLPEQLSVGVEIEKFGVISETGQALTYGGEGGIKDILQLISERFGWNSVREKDIIIALTRDNLLISLEPGGQMEFSSEHYPQISGVAREFEQYLTELKEAASPFSICFISLGMHPFSTEEDVERVPKGRYKIMSRYLSKKGKLGLQMMKLTSAIQATYDYTSEEDAMEMLKVSQGLSSLVTAMTANSPISEGRPNGFMSKRAHIWLDTDPDRCGLIRKAFEPGFSFQDYAEFVSNIPMMFIKREDWVPFHGITFQEYVEKGYEGYYPTVEDWELHLTSVFTEVRMKQFLEVRGSDAPPPSMIFSVPALWKGILYNQQGRDAAWKLVRDLTWEERLMLQRDVSRYGLDAKIRGKKVLGLAEELVRIAREGLSKERNIGKEDETHFLEPLEELIIERHTCPAGVLLDEWEKGLRDDPQRLIEYCGY